MLTIGTRHRRRGTAAAATLGALLVVGTAVAPAHADSTRSQQWFLDAMQAETMWKTSTGKGITVALVDSGVDADNPDLKGQLLPGKDFATGERGDESTDYDGHGTGMAGLIAGTGGYGGGQGAYGLAPGAKVLPIRVPDSEKSANRFEQQEEFENAISTAIRYAADRKAQVINVSMGFTGATGTMPKIEKAVDYALKRGSLIFAAAGNDGDKGNELGYPVGTPGVVGVGAIGKDLHRASFSTHGPQVDISAPGDEMVHACGGKTGLCKTQGTSDAAALASASAALIWSAHPDWTNNQVLRVMLNTIGAPTDGAMRNDSIGYGIVRPRIALKTPGDPGPADKFPMADYPAQAAEKPSSEPSRETGAQVPEADGQSGDSGGNTGLWIGLGVGAAVLIAGAVTAVALRNRRKHPQPGQPAQQQPPAYPAAYAQQPYNAAPPPNYAPQSPNTPQGGPYHQPPRQ